MGQATIGFRAVMSIFQLVSLRILPTPMEDPEMVCRVRPPPIRLLQVSALLFLRRGILRYHPILIGTSNTSFLMGLLSLLNHFPIHQLLILYHRNREELLWDLHTI